MLLYGGRRGSWDCEVPSPLATYIIKAMTFSTMSTGTWLRGRNPLISWHQGRPVVSSFSSRLSKKVKGRHMLSFAGVRRNRVAVDLSAAPSLHKSGSLDCIGRRRISSGD